MSAARAWSTLQELGVLCVAGSDARAFLQGQLSNDIERLTSESAQLGSLSTAQGRVIAVLRLVLRPEGIIAVLPASLVTPVIERLKKYVLRAKVELRDDSQRLGAIGLIDLNIPVTPDRHVSLDALGAGLARNEVSVHRLPGPRDRHLLLGPPSALASAAANSGAALTTYDPWRLAGIESGEPQVYPQTSDLFVAQMLNLDLIDGVSFSKGCYTGQEIIARTQHRGRIKRRMLRYRVRESGALAPGDTVFLENRTGRVVEFASRNAAEGEMLAVVPLEVSGRSEHDESARAPQIERAPLPYSIPDLDQGPEAVSEVDRFDG